MSDDLMDASVDDAPEENSVSEAANAIAELLKKKPEADEEEDAPPAPPSEAKPDQAPDPQLEAMKAQALRAAEEAEQARASLAATLHHMVPQLGQSIRGEFADIKSPADMVRLAQENPARYNRLIAAQEHFAQAAAARAQMARQEQHQTQVQRAAWRQQEMSQVASALPELSDPEKGPALANRIQDFAIKAGYSPQHLAMASATDLTILHRAMQFDGLDTARDVARAKAARAPRVFEPGARGEAPNRLQSDFERLRKSGSTSDAAAVFDNFLK